MKANQRVVLSIVILIWLAALSMIVSADSVEMKFDDLTTSALGTERHDVVQKISPPAPNLTIHKEMRSTPLPQLYLFSGSEYARYDILKNKFEGTNSISKGYPGVPFSKIDAAYVDTWSY